ncbi:ester cyclase [Streptomyces sp. NPDC020192]|uniref:ester cyclase n=1 Tax=Streptomyces sp. NPDC020192 TaxID=3365066 RepID=UPI0037AACCE9
MTSGPPPRRRFGPAPEAAVDHFVRKVRPGRNDRPATLARPKPETCPADSRSHTHAFTHPDPNRRHHRSGGKPGGRYRRVLLRPRQPAPPVPARLAAAPHRPLARSGPAGGAHRGPLDRRAARSPGGQPGPAVVHVLEHRAAEVPGRGGQPAVQGQHAAGRPQGPTGPVFASKNFRTAVPDLTCELSDVLVTGDEITARLVFRGHFTGTFNDVQGNGQNVDFNAIDIQHVGTDKIIEDWHIEDNERLLTQLGVNS